MKTLSEHWDEIFKNTEETKLGWFETEYVQTLKLLDLIPEWKESNIFIPGVGTSDIVNILLKSKATLVLNDLSPVAIEKIQDKYKAHSTRFHCLCQDISKPLPQELKEFDIWIDRAVLHFLTDEDDIQGYFHNVRSFLKEDGYALFAEFSLKGAPKCAGLTLHRYSTKKLSERLGPEFKLVEQFDYIYTNPYGEPKPYLYALYKRERPNPSQVSM